MRKYSNRSKVDFQFRLIRPFWGPINPKLVLLCQYARRASLSVLTNYLFWSNSLLPIVTRNYFYLGFDEMFVLGLMWFCLTRLELSVMNYLVSHRTGHQGRDVAMRVSWTICILPLYKSVHRPYHYVYSFVRLEHNTQ